MTRLQFLYKESIMNKKNKKISFLLFLNKNDYICTDVFIRIMFNILLIHNMYKKYFLLILPVFLFFACSKKESLPEKETGYLILNVSQGVSTKTGIEIEDFTLRIRENNVGILEEIIKELPEQISLPVGTYTVEAYSAEFSEPRFDMPVYSGVTTVEIVAGAAKEASLICSQSNAGIKVVWSDDFPVLYGSYRAEITGDAGYLNYMHNETRTGYFLPGTVSISIHADGLIINGGTITLAAKDMVTVSLRPKYSPSGNMYIEMSIDETVNEREVEITVDPDDAYTENTNSETNPYSIAQAIEFQGNGDGVWVTGYIVGSKPTGSYDFVNGTWINSNIVIADDIYETDSYKVIFVDLSNAGMKNGIGLLGSTTQVYSERLYRKVMIKGNLRGFQSRSGLRDLTEYYLVSE